MIGPSIVRLILGRWLKPETVVDISPPLIDFLKTKTEDIFAQREANRLFEKIGDDVANNLMERINRNRTNNVAARKA